MASASEHQQLFCCENHIKLAWGAIITTHILPSCTPQPQDIMMATAGEHQQLLCCENHVKLAWDAIISTHILFSYIPTPGNHACIWKWVIWRTDATCVLQQATAVAL